MNKNHLFWLKNGLLLIFLVIVDQITKYFAEIYLQGHNSITIIKNIVSFSYLEGGNTGAAWGMFSGNKIGFIIITIIAVIIIFKFMLNIYYLYKNNYSLNLNVNLVRYALVILVAGAIGNFIDRVVRGYVVDFIRFDFVNFPIFNVADIYVTLSCIFILIICIFKMKGETFNEVFSFKKIKNDK